MKLQLNPLWQRAHRYANSLNTTDLDDLFRSKAFIALPGGYGTLAELLEVITAKQLGQIDGDVRIGVLNINGFYDGLLAFFKQAEEAGFLRLKGGIHVVSEPTAERLWKSLCL